VDGIIAVTTGVDIDMTEAAIAPGEVALVTGGAKRVGRAIVLRLAEAGYGVAIHCNESVGEAEELAATIVAAGGRATVVSADLVDPASVEGIIPVAAAQLGPVTLLVNNASMFAKDSLTAIDVPTWNRQFSVNIRAPSVLAGIMAKALPEGRNGAIVNILDQRVWKLTPEYYSYTLSKAAMWAATRTMAQALSPRIRVNAVGPGPTVANTHDGEALFLKEAAKYHVLPMDDRVFERLDAASVGRPDLMAGRTSLTLADGMSGMMEGVFINVKNRSKTITAEIDVPQGGAKGTILAQGGRFGGWSLYVKDGVPAFDYNFLGLKQTSIAASQPLAPGKATLKFDFAYDGGGPGKGGVGTLFVNGAKVAEGRIEHTQAALFSADETADVGIDLGTPVVEAIGSEHKSIAYHRAH
jgi:NAD(P)-dependent dehydrogenase (short-subunit alcohol dehydrogenase family)